jgi:hypothetical protein
MGVPLARCHHGNGNILGDASVPHWPVAHRTGILTAASQRGSTR